MPVLGAASTNALKTQQSIFFPEDYGAKADGTTDDTTAIQSAIDAACAASGIVQFAAKTYLVNGVPRTDRGGYAILAFPQYATAGPVVTLRGVGTATPQTPTGTIIKTTRTDVFNGVTGSGGIGVPCVIGGPSIEVHSTASYTQLNASIENLTVLLPQNPTLAGIDLALVERARIDNVVVLGNNPTTTVPTTASSFGLRMPTSINAGYSHIGSYFGYGLYQNVIGNTEHFTADAITGKWCVGNVAITGLGGAHASLIGYIQSEWCLFHLSGWLVGSGRSDFQSKVVVHIGLLDIEDQADGNAFATTTHIADVNNYLHGRVHYSRYKVGITGFQTGALTNRGATAVTLVDLTA